MQIVAADNAHHIRAIDFGNNLMGIWQVPCLLQTMYANSADLQSLLIQVGHQAVGVCFGRGHKPGVPGGVQKALQVSLQPPVPSRPLWLVCLCHHLLTRTDNIIATRLCNCLQDTEKLEDKLFENHSHH